jgi:hypothetical protein
MRWISALTLCLAALLLPAASAQALESIFEYTGAEQTFEVPTGVYQIEFVAIGGHGGEANGPAGGEAAEVKGKLDVEAGRTYYIEVGGNGQSNAEGGEGGFNGGAGGGGGGGGATDIRTESNVVSLATEDTRLVVAGGGGGGGSTGSETGGTGGAAGEPGGPSSYGGGGAGTQTAGGAGAEGCVNFAGNGEIGFGGDGGFAAEATGPGGGGGGGYYGGGGGAGACVVGSSGGGGGSSLVPPLASQTLTTAQPVVKIKYNPPPSVTITNPVDKSVFTQDKVVHVSYGCMPGSGAMLKTCAGEDWIGPVADGEELDTSEVGEFTFSVFAEDMDKGQTGKSVAYKVVEKKEEPTPPGPTPPGPSGPAPLAAVPDTTLGSHPKKTVKTSKSKAKVKFSFSSDVAGATFQCKLDKGAFTPCTSPKTYKAKPGRHTFTVEALAPAGTDATPATFSFKVKKTT